MKLIRFKVAYQPIELANYKVLTNKIWRVNLF